VKILNWKNETSEGIVKGSLLVKEAKVGTTKSDKPFLGMKLSNGVEEIDARKWDYNEQIPEIGDIIYIEGKVQEYLNTPQLIIHRFRKALEDEYNISDFLPSLSDDKIQELTDEFNETIRGLSETYRVFINELVVNNNKRYFVAPAAKVHHHAYIGGLLEHSLAVCKRSLVLAELSTMNINKDLLIAGSLLHDIGKIYAYEFDKPPIRMSTEGRLLEHIAIGLNLVSDTYKNTMSLLDKEDYLHLQHMIASHHGKLEWGSPIVPKTIEAEILHMADNLDAIDFKYNKAVQEKTENQEWSDWVKTLGKEIWIK